MNITDITLEPYSHKSGSYDPSVIIEFYIKIKFGDVWYKSEKYYKMEDALSIRDKIKLENVNTSGFR